MLAQEREHDHGELGALRLVDADGVGEVQVVGLRALHRHEVAVEVDLQRAALVDIPHDPEVPVEDAEVVVVAGLDDLVARRDAAGGAGPAPQALLQREVEGVDAARALVHGGEHLDVAQRIGIQAPGQDLGAQAHGGADAGLGVVGADEVDVARLEVERRRVRRRGGRVLVAMQDGMGGADDAAARALAEDGVQPRDRHEARGDEVVEHAARAHRGQLVDVADEQQVGAVGHGPQERRGQPAVEHGGLIDDHRVGLDGVVRAVGEAPGRRVEFQEPVQGARAAPGGLGHALGGAAGGRGEHDPASLGAEDVAERPQDGGLARARTAREDADLAADGRGHGRALQVGEREAGAVLRPGDRLLDRDGRQASGRAEQAGHGGGDGGLGRGQGRELDEAVGSLAEDRDGALAHEGVEALRHDRPVDPEQLGRLVDEAVLGEGAVPIGLQLAEGVQEAGVDALRAGGGQAEVARDLVGGQEAHALDLAADAVGLGGQDVPRALPVGLDDAQAEGVRDAVRLQEHHHLAQAALLVPRRLDRLGALGPDALDLAQARRVVRDDLEGALAELGHDLVGVDLAHAMDEPAAEVLADAMDGRREARAEGAHPELGPVLGVAFPRALEVDRLPALHPGEVAEDHHLGAGLLPELRDGEALLLVQPDDALDDAGERLRRAGALGLAVHEATLRGGGPEATPGAGGLRLSAAPAGRKRARPGWPRPPAGGCPASRSRARR